MLRDLGVSYVTYDEVEHEAPVHTAPGPARDGALMTLPVVS